MTHTAILATGGIDSTLLMYELAARNPIIISFNFGQLIWPLQKELILYHMKNVGITTKFVELTISYADWQRKPGLFTEGYAPDKEDIELHNDDKPPHFQYYIEGKTMIMIGYALAYCSAHGIEELIAGFEYEKNEWPNMRTPKLIADDTSPLFVDTMNIAALFGFSNHVRLRAPFYEQRMDKEAIVKRCLQLGIDLDKTYTCYFYPGPCGKCDNCQLKEAALKKTKHERK